MHELQFILNERKNTLDTLMMELMISEVKETDAIFLNSNTVLNMGLCNAFLKRFDNYVGNFIYTIELDNQGETDLIKQSFETFQRSNKLLSNTARRHVSIFNKTNSRILYVGVKCNRIKNRIKQHLGYGPSKSTALHLCHWVPEDVNLKIEVYKISSSNQEYLKFLEKGFWDTLQPMFGKRKVI